MSVFICLLENNSNLVEQRPVNTGTEQHGEQNSADKSSGDDDKLADDDEVDFESVGPHLPRHNPVDGQRSGNDYHHSARDDEVTQVHVRTYVVHYSVGDLQPHNEPTLHSANRTQIQTQIGICRERLTNCPGALTNVRMLCETGELLEVFESIGVSCELNAGR